MIRVRFAPSPTGFLHIGGARSYIFNWLFARKQGGQVVLRIDDTDLERSTQESLQSILDGLGWLDLPWDEQHRQSDRRAAHEAAAQALLDKGAAYRDFTVEDKSSTGDTGYSGWLCNPGMRELASEESDHRARAGEAFVLRFRTPRDQEGGVPFKDLVFKKQYRKMGDIEDFALARSDGSPTYHLASCVDDAELKISHVIRGQDHLTNTFKHILILQGLGQEIPQFGHLPLLLGPDQSKLSKRKHGPIVSVTNYRDAGFLPHAFVNYLSLLGWSPKDDREVLSIDELTSAFDIAGVQKANAVVQYDEASEDWAPPKAVWVNGQHLRSMPVAELMPFVEPVLRKAGWWPGEASDDLLKKVDAIRARYTLLSDFSSLAKPYFSDEFDTDEKAANNLAKDNARELLREMADPLAALDEFNAETVEEAVRAYAAEKEVKPGLLINGSRAALTGQAVGPSAFLLFELIGREKTVERLRAC